MFTQQLVLGCSPIVLLETWICMLHLAGVGHVSSICRLQRR